MNTARSHLDIMEGDFSTVLKTVESYEFFESAIALCNDLNMNYDLSETDRNTVIAIMMSFQKIYRTMNTRDYISLERLSTVEITQYNEKYNYIL